MKRRAQVRSSAVVLGALVAAGVAAGCGNESQPGPGGSAGMPIAGSGATASGSGGVAGSGAGGAGENGGGVAGASGSAGAAGSAGAGGGSAGCRVSKTDAEQPMLLSETKCVDMVDPTRPASGLVPYSVRSALWSDDAEKERFMRIPDGAKIHPVDCATDVDLCGDPGAGGDGLDDGQWDLPIGTVLVKSFIIEGTRIETRLLMRRTSRVWKGFSYEWNEAGTEAELLPDTGAGKDKPVGTGPQIWHYPSRSQCLECHTQYAGRSLGPSTGQLNSDYPYADGTMNQVEKLTQLGLFDTPPKDLPGYPDPFGAGTLEERARSYIHTNCAICHRPGGEFSTVDMRFTTALADSNLCGESQHDEGLVPKYRLVPGEPTLSAMSTRMHAVDDPEMPDVVVRMPKLGSTVVDVEGAKLIDDWITSLPTDACPPQPQ